MNEIALSDNLAQIELEINHHKQIAGQSIWEIGRRLNHVKENDLAHGQFGKWLEKIGIQYREANRMMTVAKKLPNVTTLSDLGNTALYLIATLPDEEKQTQLDRIEQGDNPTVRELQEVKRQLNQVKAELKEKAAQNERLAEVALQKAEPEIIEKEVVVEKIPDDYEASKALAEASKRNEEFYKNQNSELRKEMRELERIIKDKDSQLLSQAELQKLKVRKANLDNLSIFNESVETFLHNSGSLIYSEQFVSSISRLEFHSSIAEGVSRIEKWINDMKVILSKGEIIEEQ
ncbi:TPA: DUF3102 domain-containing protein [Streptococcus suis]|nr:DUF3102 domain-containing protein [Streptococcus suis]HEM4975109.1 DUF3102 domain-containing protein [Streptococcus suis]HEM5288953.1 DUF3102 domain-containing protein [Streptococcus suis]HEM5299144.1 DUF3102 domain-containing protein [Streptococcus suis]HEM5302677.1 DUF3102 domain-containing protein [Streptococcus suis]